MNITLDTPIDVLNCINKNTVMETLGMEYTEVGEGYVRGIMPVDHRTIQPMGILSGGASLAFGEVLGGLGSSLLVDLNRYAVVGTQVSGNHVGMAHKGTVTGEARMVHRGRRTHVWNIDITNEAGALVSSVRLTNLIIERQHD